jgi:hypothetical protein
MGTERLWQASPLPVERIVYVPLNMAPDAHSAKKDRPDSTPAVVLQTAGTTTGAAYLQMRDNVLRWGTDSLAPSSARAVVNESPLRLGEFYDSNEDALRSISSVQTSAPESTAH